MLYTFFGFFLATPFRHFYRYLCFTFFYLSFFHSYNCIYASHSFAVVVFKLQHVFIAFVVVLWSR